jgi:hypothetical protein
LLLRTRQAAPRQRTQPQWSHFTPASEGRVLEGPWQLQFLSGGPQLPAAVSLAALSAWTALPDPEASRFSGTARYRLEFDAPSATAEQWRIELGEVRETAAVKLNGRLLGLLWSRPFSVDLGPHLRPQGNVLEIEVTNLPANRIRDLDQRRVDWKIMKDTNLVNLRYRPFDASAWKVEPSGLLGPVRLVPMKRINPAQTSP